MEVYGMYGLGKNNEYGISNQYFIKMNLNFG